MSILVQRQPADKPGDDIVDSILTTPEAQLERGTHAINHNDRDRMIATGTVERVDFVSPRLMVRIMNKGVSKIGLVSKFSGHISISDSVDIHSQITVELIK